MWELMKLWELLNYSCGERLAAIIMPKSVAKLECLQDGGNVAGTYFATRPAFRQ